MNWTFLIGLIAGYLLSIVANLSTPKTQTILARWSRTWAERQKRGMGKDLARVRRYKDDRPGFQEALLRQIWMETECGKIAIVGMGLLILCCLPGGHIPPRWIESVAGIAAIIVLFSFMIPNLAGANLHNDLVRLKDFEEYEKKVLKAIEEDPGNA